MARVVSALLLLLASSQAIDVRLPPSIITGPEITRHGPKKHQMFKIYDTIALPCVATGTPDPEYEWYRDGSLMDLNRHVNIKLDLSQPGTGSIVIEPAYSLDEGYYQCRVENEHGVAVSQVVYLQRARLDPVTSGSAKDYPVTEGEALKLPCSTGVTIPIPKYSWSTAETADATGSTPIVLNKRINIDEEGNLYFSYVVPEDAKSGYVYMCNVFNNILDIQSGGSYAKVQVINNPAATDLRPENMYHTPDDVIAIKGKEQRLKCLFKGKPEVSISWGRDTSVGLPPYHKVQSSTTELVINPVELDDEAVYTCTGSNVMGSTPQNINVRVEAEPEFEIATDRPRDMNITEGDVAEFRCWAFAIPDAKVQWFINAERFEDVKPGNRYQISADGKTLIIEDVCKDCDHGTSDIMNIQCNASNVHGYTYDGGYLNVLRATTIASEDGPVSTSIKYGEENITSLDCFATSDDSTPISYKWLHDGKDVDYHVALIWMDENNSLIIKVGDEDTAKKYVGEYTCRATNGYSTAVASAVVNLEGYYPKEVWFLALPAESPVTDDIRDLLSADLTEDNVVEVANKLETLTSDSEILTYTDISAGSEILQKLTEADQTGEEIGEQVVETANNMLNADTQHLAFAEKSKKSTSGIIKSLEKYSLAADLEEENKLIESEDITLEMWDISNTVDSISGFGRQATGDQKVVNYRSFEEVKLEDTKTAIIMSEEVQHQAQELFDKSAGKDREEFRMTFALYRKPKLFVTPEQLSFPFHPSAVNSEVIALNLPLLNEMPLDGPIWAIFHPQQNPRGTTTCVYWDFDASDGYGNWSSRGCSKNKTEKGRVICQCNHLTNFAILMDPKGALSGEHETALSLITYLGLGLSSAGLALTILTFLIFRKKLRFGRGQKVLVNLAVALLCVNVIFMAGIKRTENEHVCVAMAALLHYLLLVAFAWMLVEAVLQYLRLVKVIGVHVERFMLKAALPSWLLPSLLVVALVCTHYFTEVEMYGVRDPDYCWLEEYPLYFGFMLPVGLIILINAGFYIRIVKSITCDRPDNMRSTQSRSDLTKLQVCCSLSVFVLLGLTWVFGFLAMTDARIVFHYVFCILNSFQGFLIFFCHTFLNKQTRDSWCKYLCPSRYKRKELAREKDKTDLSGKPLMSDTSRKTLSTTEI